MLSVIIWIEYRVPNEGARKSLQGAEGVPPYRRNNNVN
jgi:hypothetical protein